MFWNAQSAVLPGGRGGGWNKVIAAVHGASISLRDNIANVFNACTLNLN